VPNSQLGAEGIVWRQVPAHTRYHVPVSNSGPQPADCALRMGCATLASRLRCSFAEDISDGNQLAMTADEHDEAGL